MNKSLKAFLSSCFLLATFLSPLIVSASSDIFVYPHPVDFDGYDRTEDIFIVLELTNFDIDYSSVDIYMGNSKNKELLTSGVPIQMARLAPIPVPIDLGEVAIIDWDRSVEWFNVFVCEIDKECDLQDRSIRDNILGGTNIQIIRPSEELELDFAVNSRNGSINVNRGDSLKVEWTGDAGFYGCSAFGTYLPDDEGGTWPSESPLDVRTSEGLIMHYSNLDREGRATLIARPRSGGQQAIIGIQCSPSDRNYGSVSKKIIVNISDNISDSIIVEDEQEEPTQAPAPITDIQVEDIDVEDDIQVEDIEVEEPTQTSAPVTDTQVEDIEVDESNTGELPSDEEVGDKDELITKKEISEKVLSNIEVDEITSIKLSNRRALVYEVIAKKKVRLLGLFDRDMSIKTEVSMETGEIVSSRSPWWSFLAF